MESEEQDLKYLVQNTCANFLFFAEALCYVCMYAWRYTQMNKISSCPPFILGKSFNSRVDIFFLFVT